jgi:abortive infection bacteriophage resistance protein
MSRFSVFQGGLLEYSKPHLSYFEQIELLRSRGMEIDDVIEAQEILKNIGYYRLSGYFYPYRQFGVHEHNELQQRIDTFRLGTNFGHVKAIFEFDSQLRLTALSGLESFETSLRAITAYVVGTNTKFAHYELAQLHPKTKQEEHSKWLKKYKNDMNKAGKSDFLKHFNSKYSGKCPIWIAVEFMQFGTLTHLYGLLQDQHKDLISREFGFSTRKSFHVTLDSFRQIRNLCAHHSRLWNMNLDVQIPHISRNSSTNTEIYHLNEIDSTKLYKPFVILGHTLRQLKNERSFIDSIRGVISNFPEVPALSPISDMGFPEGWQEMDYWS